VQQRYIEFAVGLFLLLGLTAMMFLAINVTQIGQEEQRGKRFAVYAYFNNVAGLNERAKVSFAGVTIGRVAKIAIDPDTLKAKVTLEINQHANYIPSDTTAVIYTEGVLGEKYIGLSQGTESTVLVAESEIQDTQSSLILEELIAKLATRMINT